MHEQDMDTEMVVPGTLFEVSLEALAALELFWQVAEPLLRRNATRNLMLGLSSNFWRACDGLRHSAEVMRGAPLLSSDGTLVWPEPATAVTNESEEPSHGDEERPEMAASGSGSRSGDSGSYREGRALEDGPTGPEWVPLEPAHTTGSTSTYARRETEEDKERHRKAAQENRRLKALRGASRRKQTKRITRRR